ncbi:glycosyltransferase family 2 protein [Bacteroides heparinolyticus]|uniref:glycosyltransferase family 2 protein n=1 Tax=Prevotella heparinolytica TaxID=28113 RepID=UPI0023F03471|nr:glycosyltransferase family 2 protein [Bacteroides heparinolyticus]MCF0254689.1 glycosyltransferase family 2 protein [Bacteroides heparinolyticus]
MVSIITVNYNGWQDTCELLSSLKKFETYPHEVIVVDNASKGDDAERISAAHPDAVVVRSEHNLGFAGGNNLGYRYASGEYLFFLNNDMVVKHPMLEPMVARLSDLKIGGVSPCIHYLYKPEELQYYGYRDMTPLTLKHTTEPFDPLRAADFMQPKETEVLHGGAMMVRRDVMEAVGRMTEVYFLFYEEFDWSHRMRKAGYTLYYEPGAEVYHKESMSIPKSTPFREYYLSRARMIYARRNCSGWRKPLACAYLLLVVLPKKMLMFAIEKRLDLLSAIWRGTFAGFLKRSVSG